MTPGIDGAALAEAFPETCAPGTDRRAFKLTDGPGFCYPLYYFIPSLSRDGRYLVHHRAHDGEVQLVRLDLTTGESVTLTDASATDAQWHTWCTDPGSGVLDHRSVLNVERGTVLAFDGPTLRRIDLETLTDERVFELPEGRRATGQNCVTPDGQWFVYIHLDRESFDEVHGGDGFARHRAEGAVLAASNLESGEHRVLVRIDSAIHHVLPYDDEHVLFCHPATESGMLLTDLEGGWYTHLRTQDVAGGCVNHFLSTDAGITYEVDGGFRNVRGGIYDPFTHDRFEFSLPDSFGYTHTGYDPAGELFFYETTGGGSHRVCYLARHDPGGEDDWQPLVGDWPTYGGGQKAHFHPRLTPDRDWLLMTAGDPETETNQVYAIDVADIDRTRGVPTVCQ